MWFGISLQAPNDSLLQCGTFSFADARHPRFCLLVCRFDGFGRHKSGAPYIGSLDRFENHVGQKERQFLNLLAAFVGQLDNEIANGWLRPEKSIEFIDHLFVGVMTDFRRSEEHTSELQS